MNLKGKTPEEVIQKLRSYKVRTCIYLNECCWCGKAIRAGEQYFDGGYGRRAHVNCIGRGGE